MNNRIVLTALAVVLVGVCAFMMCDESEAATGDVLASGSCGTNLTYEVKSLNDDDSQLEFVVFGQGDMYNYTSSSSGRPPWYQYRTQIVSANFPATMTSIGASAFEGCRSLALTELPAGVTSIGAYAFEGCRSLALTELPAGVTSINEGAFRGCTALALTELPAGVTSIGAYAFYNCTALALTELPAGVTSIGASAFYNCTALTRMVIPESVETLNRSVFANCTGLTDLTLPITIGGIYQSSSTYRPFNGCTNIQKITFLAGNGVQPDYTSSQYTSMPWYIARNALIEIVYSEGITHIGNYGLYGALNVGEIILPSTLVSIGSNAFQNCTALDTDLPSSVQTVGDYAFADCTSLSLETLPSTLDVIGQYAFRNCTAIRGLEFNNTVTVGDNAFSGISFYDFDGNIINPTSENLRGRTFLGNGDGILSQLGITGECYWRLSGNTLYITGPGTMGDYVQTGSGAAPWPMTITAVVFSGGVTNVGDYAFTGREVLESATLEEGMTSVGEGAFLGCHGLTSAELPSTVTVLGKSAFAECTNLSMTSLPSGLTTIGDDVFDRCVTLALTSLPPGVTSIGASAFFNCPNVTFASLPSGLTVIRESAFGGCSGIVLTSLPTGVTAIERGAFSGCSSLALTSLPAGLTDLGMSAFSGCTALAITSLPDGITVLPEDVFHGCSHMPLAELPDGLVTIGNGAFYDCTQLAVTEIPVTVTSIGENAFYRCSEVTSLSMPVIACTADTGLHTLGSIRFTDMKDVLTQANAVYTPQYTPRTALTDVTFDTDWIAPYVLYGQTDALGKLTVDPYETAGWYDTVTMVPATQQSLTATGDRHALAFLTAKDGENTVGADGSVSATGSEVSMKVVIDGDETEVSLIPSTVIYPSEYHKDTPSQYAFVIDLIPVLTVLGVFLSVALFAVSYARREGTA